MAKNILIQPRRKLELSELNLTQQELLAQDVDLEKFKLVISNGFGGPDIREKITAATVTRTIEGASTLEVTINDYDREFLRSGVYHSKVDVNTEGLWWRMRIIDKQGDDLTITFEDREIAILRTYAKHIAPINRANLTRAEFILRLIKEVKEVSIPYYIPELTVQQTVFSSTGNILLPGDRQPGLSQDEKITITDSAGGNSRPMTIDQILTANAILLAADHAIPDSYIRKRKIMVCAIMTAITEAQLSNPASGDLDSQGAFQQRPSQGWPNSLDIVVETNAFVDAALKADSAAIGYGDLCQKVQRSAFGSRYALHRQEGENVCDAAGYVGNDRLLGVSDINASRIPQFTAANSGYYFYRGEPPSRKHQAWKAENSWNCIQRYAAEVNWRAFFVSGIFYYIDEQDLFKSQPRAILTEKAEGVDNIDGEYDVNKKVADISATVRMGKFEIPPGCVVKVTDHGPYDGRWLVSTIARDLFSPVGSLELKKPEPALLEPPKNNLPKYLIPTSNTGWGGPTTKSTTGRTASGWLTIPPALVSDASNAANQILEYSRKGLYKDDNLKQLAQLRLIADGKPIQNQCGELVYVDAKSLNVVNFLIGQGWRIGTYAICSDHSCYVKGSNPARKSPHSLGKAIDVSSIAPQDYTFYSLADNKAQDRPLLLEWVSQAMVQLQSLDPDQILCNGVGGTPDSSIQALQMTGHTVVDGPTKIVDDHTTHFHVGF